TPARSAAEPGTPEREKKPLPPAPSPKRRGEQDKKPPAPCPAKRAKLRSGLPLPEAERGLGGGVLSPAPRKASWHRPGTEKPAKSGQRRSVQRGKVVARSI